MVPSRLDLINYLRGRCNSNLLKLSFLSNMKLKIEVAIVSS